MMIAAIIALFISGGTVFAAEGSLPGDTLYPVKIHVTEEVRGWAALSDEADARWEIRKAGRRMEEAKELEAEGRLSDEAKAEIGQSIAVSAQSFAAEIKALRKDGKVDEAKALRAEFVSEVHAHTGADGKVLSLDLDDALEIAVGEDDMNESSDDNDAEESEREKTENANGTSSVSEHSEDEEEHGTERSDDEVRGNNINWNFEGGTKIEGKTGGEVSAGGVIEAKADVGTGLDASLGR